MFNNTSMKQNYYTIMKHSLLSFLIIFISFFLHTSASYAVNDPRELYQVFSPEVATMTRYGTFPVSYYTGQPDISIPIYTVKSGDYEIPISLKYDASGFRPNNPDGLLGQSWSFTGIGMITRQIRGIPDDEITSTSPSPYPSGFLNLAKNNNLASKTSLLNIGNYLIGPINGTFILNINGVNYREYEPDLFTVCLPNGKSFQFMLDNSGIPQVLGHGVCKVNLDSVSIQTPGSEILRSKITIIDEDGYVYVFGGDLSKLEVLYQPEYIDDGTPCSKRPLNTQLNTKKATINAWYLSTITNPHNENIATYSYLQTPVTSLTDFPYLRKQLSWTFYMNESLLLEHENLHITKLAIPTSITTTNHHITFDYEISNTSFYGNDINGISQTSTITSPTYCYRSISYPNNFRCSTYLLNNISITDYESTLNTQIYYIVKHTEEDSHSTDRHFLYEATTADKTYRFSYYYSNLPLASTTKLDMQGYYNGNANSLYPTGNPINWSFSHRSTNPDYANLGMLKSIKYPTGGTTTFEFESHQYGKIVKRKTDGTIGENIVNEYGYVGGTRIKKITNSDGIITEFSYLHDDTSSGIFYDSGVFTYYYNSSTNNCATYGIFSNSISPQVDLGEHYIGYSSIKVSKHQINSTDNLVNYYSFTNRISNPDTAYISNNNIKIISDATNNPTSFIAQTNKLLVYSSKCMERGLIKSELLYKGASLIKQILYDYNYSTSLYSHFIVGSRIILNGCYAVSVNSYATYLYGYDTKTITTRTFGNGAWVEEKIVEEKGGMAQAMPHNFTTKLIKCTSKGDSIYTIYKRPLDYGVQTSYYGEQMKGIFFLQKHNRLSPVIEEAKFIKDVANDIDYLIESTITDYRHEYNSPTPKYIHKTKLTAPLPSSQYTMSNVSGNSFNYQSDIFSTHVSFDMYNPTGKLLQLTDQAGVSTSYIWGYGNQRLLAIVEGEKYTNFSNYWGGGQGAMIMNYRGEDRFPTSEYLQSVNNLRNQISVPITTYTHSPLFGVTSITNPMGVTRYYDYYPSGELKSEYRFSENGHKQILKAYDYKYQEVAQ